MSASDLAIMVDRGDASSILVGSEVVRLCLLLCMTPEQRAMSTICVDSELFETYRQAGWTRTFPVLLPGPM